MQNSKTNIVIIAVVTLLIAVVGYAFFTSDIQRVNNNIPTDTSTENTPTPVPTPTLVPTEISLIPDINASKTIVVGHHISEYKLETGTNLQGHSLVSYPLKQSPVYGKLVSRSIISCYDSYYAGKKDVCLVKNDSGEILIPSLLQLISTSDNREPDCTTVIGLFSVPDDGKYLYLHTRHTFAHDAPNSGLSGIYRLDLSDLLVKKLTVSDFVGSFDLYRGKVSDSYKMLPDDKRLIKWNMNGVYLINLETDSKSALYTVPQNQWLISNITTDKDWGNTAYYDVNVTDNVITVSVYEKDEDGESVATDKYGGGEIRQKFINQVTLSIPN